ncbi:MAG: hypothetical protein CVT49_06650 [candidate division Zixibacteria bacterium HGW-Zixibacteria-1]|nr:MAG: hypothetical protein CVT49_06650 [candidate division Zixibacteria bacterium HGW-Zixibacteria-1]
MGKINLISLKIIVIASIIGCLATSAMALSLKKGDKLKIVVSGGQDYMGDLLLIDSKSITLLGWEERRFAAKEIEKAYIWKKNRAVPKSYGFLFGLPVGALVGYIYEKEIKNDYTYTFIGSRSVKERTDPDTKTIVIFACGGGLAGAIVGSFINGYEPIKLSDLFRTSVDINANYSPQKHGINLIFSYSF